eukprot:TRINITY_DN10281_c0_g1_i1.p1 TRINITY_DN10281_c0_g1~~TRINITY_DN10281_c0_g1_i1.p1  ORF type:complete len:1126 (+),score=274.53 TRINITY_DN10281_c0_g1_i1:133-3510(+)
MSRHDVPRQDGLKMGLLIDLDQYWLDRHAGCRSRDRSAAVTSANIFTTRALEQLKQHAKGSNRRGASIVHKRTSEMNRVGRHQWIHAVVLMALCAMVFIRDTVAAPAPLAACPRSSSTVLVIQTDEDVAAVRAAMDCKGNNILVIWKGAATLASPLVVEQGTQLRVQGMQGAVVRGTGAAQLFRILSQASLELENVILEGGSSVHEDPETTGKGGAIFVDAAQLSVNSCEFRNNSGYIGGAIMCASGNCTIFDTTFSDNSGTVAGGALACYRGSTCSTSTCTFTGNSAGVGGAMYAQEAEWTVLSSVFANNTGGSGGALYAFGGNGSVFATNITGNSALDSESEGGGGGAYFEQSHVTIDSSYISENTATSSGGGLSASVGAMVTITDSVVSKNSAGGNGGGISCSLKKCVLSISTSTISDNTATGLGGAIALNEGTYGIAMESTSIVGNSASLGGGAAVLSTTGPTHFDQCEFANNTASTGGGGMYLQNLPLGVAHRMLSTSFDSNVAVHGGGGAILQSGDGARLGVEVDDAVVFEGNAASCCYAGGQGALAGVSCVDVTTGWDTYWECCATGQYINGNACGMCNAPESTCSTYGETVETMTLGPGYWRESLSQTDIRACWRPDACDGGMATSEPDQYCAEGYEGPYCSVCADGYAAAPGYQCLNCNGGLEVVTFLLTVLALLALMVVAWASVSMARHSEKALAMTHGRAAQLVLAVSARLRTPVITLQILTQAVSATGSAVPRQLVTFLGVMGWVNLDFNLLRCATNFNFYGELVVRTAAPLALLPLLFAPRLLLRLKRYSLLPAHSWLRALRTRDSDMALAFLYLVFTSVSTTVLQTFPCDHLDGTAKSYLRADYSIECGTPTHTAYVAYAGIMVLVYPIGVPALFAWLLWKQRVAVRKAEALDSFASAVDPVAAAQTRAPGSFLWDSYHCAAPWWELVECARRLLLAGLLALMLPGTSAQLSLALVFALVFIVAYLYMQPHQSGVERRLSTYSATVIFVTTLVLYLARVDYMSQTAQDVTSALLIVSVLLLVLFPVAEHFYPQLGGCLMASSFHKMPSEHGVPNCHDAAACQVPVGIYISSPACSSARGKADVEVDAERSAPIPTLSYGEDDRSVAHSAQQ